MGASVVSPASSQSAPFCSSTPALISPAGGTVQLSSNDILAPPLIDSGLLSSDFDVMAFKESIKSAKRFFAAPAWQEFVLGITGPLANATTDQDVENFIRSGVFSSGHLVGTAAMSAPGANYGVVNPDLRLKRASGLRVVDASVMVSVTVASDWPTPDLTFLTAICAIRPYAGPSLHYCRTSC